MRSGRSRYAEFGKRVEEALYMFDSRHLLFISPAGFTAIAAKMEAEAEKANAALDEAYRRLDVAYDPDFGSQEAVVTCASRARRAARKVTAAGLHAIAWGVGSRGLRRALRRLADAAIAVGHEYTEAKASAYLSARYAVGEYAAAYPWIGGMTIPSI